MIFRLATSILTGALPNYTLLGVQATVLYIAVRIAHEHGPERDAFYGLWIVLALGLFGWWRALKRSRTLFDTPVSRIASAAQGYVELCGKGRPLDGTPLLSPLDGKPVLWYRINTYRMRSSRGENILNLADSRESDASFLIDDGSGICCAVDPEGAEVLAHRYLIRHVDNLFYKQWFLSPGDRIYALGEFSTLGGLSAEMDVSRQIKDLLEHWKKDRPALLRRFDANRDGEIDFEEWEAARAEARRQAMELHREILAAPEAHVMRKPKDRLYLISDLDPNRLGRRFRIWALLHALTFLAAAGALAWYFGGKT
ncbi:MAG: hypothetical protein LBR05_07710 [Azoarcus sp.]|jgi:hypothetical protein|nr:hypothetical protein [Azoarcus sp.]